VKEVWQKEEVARSGAAENPRSAGLSSPPLAERGNSRTRSQVQMQTSSSPAAWPIILQMQLLKAARLRGSQRFCGIRTHLNFAESMLTASKSVPLNVTTDR
jgi:hypothetical protein